ncbi:MAG: polysaccharide deacetylase family protein [Cyanophyceae cyanobacterium]
MQFAPLYPVLYRILKPAFPLCLWSGAEDRRAVALTFDDGPHPQYTPALLEVLNHYQVRGTFFLLGDRVRRYPDLARKIAQQGHWIGLHGYTHQAFPFLSQAALSQSLLATQAAIAQACHIPPRQVCDVRPPNGLFTPQILRQLRAEGYRIVMWSVVPEDWVRPGIAAVQRRVLSQLHNGALIVLHDGSCGGQDVVQTCAALIPQLLARHYRLVTVAQMWQT